MTKKSWWQSWGQQTRHSLLILCSCQGIRNQASPVPQPLTSQLCLRNPGAMGKEEAEGPRTATDYLFHHIRVKHKTVFERKGFTVNKHLENHHMAELTSNKRKVKKRQRTKNIGSYFNECVL